MRWCAPRDSSRRSAALTMVSATSSMNESSSAADTLGVERLAVIVDGDVGVALLQVAQLLHALRRASRPSGRCRRSSSIVFCISLAEVGDALAAPSCAAGRAPAAAARPSSAR